MNEEHKEYHKTHESNEDHPVVHRITPEEHAASAPKKKFKLTEKQMMMGMLGGFVLVPLIIFGGVFAFLNRGNSDNTTNLGPTPTVSMTKSPTEAPDPTEEPDEEVTPTKKVTTTPATTAKPTVKASATTKPGTPTPTTAEKLANLYFHGKDCVIATDSATTNEKIDGKKFTADTVPNRVSCSVQFQNSEDVETGEIKYKVSLDSDVLKNENVGKLKKGSCPDSECKKQTEGITLKKDKGTHSIRFELNPEKSFTESNYGDNTYTVTYIVE